MRETTTTCTHLLTVEAAGGPWPETGDYTSDGDRVWLVTAGHDDGSITTHGPGRADTIFVWAELADWDDLGDDDPVGRVVAMEVL